MNTGLLKYWQTKHVIAIFAIISGYVFTLLFGSELSSHHFTTCLFKNITGYPCPGCGMGRASLFLFHGEILKSLYTNPFAIPFFLAAVTALVWSIFDLVNGIPSLGKLFTKKLPTPYIIGLFILLAINWGWNVFKGM